MTLYRYHHIPCHLLLTPRQQYCNILLWYTFFTFCIFSRAASESACRAPWSALILQATGATSIYQEPSPAILQNSPKATLSMNSPQTSKKLATQWLEFAGASGSCHGPWFCLTVTTVMSLACRNSNRTALKAQVDAVRLMSLLASRKDLASRGNIVSSPLGEWRQKCLECFNQTEVNQK